MSRMTTRRDTHILYTALYLSSLNACLWASHSSWRSLVRWRIITSSPAGRSARDTLPSKMHKHQGASWAQTKPGQQNCACRDVALLARAGVCTDRWNKRTSLVSCVHDSSANCIWIQQMAHRCWRPERKRPWLRTDSSPGSHVWAGFACVNWCCLPVCACLALLRMCFAGPVSAIVVLDQPFTVTSRRAPSLCGAVTS